MSNPGQPLLLPTRPSLSRQWLACSSSRVLIYVNSLSPTSFSSNSIMCAKAGEYVALTRNSSNAPNGKRISASKHPSPTYASCTPSGSDPEEISLPQSPRAAAPQQQQPDKGEGRVVLRTPGGVGGGQGYCYGTRVFR